jgi:hypothetical protein
MFPVVGDGRKRCSFSGYGDPAVAEDASPLRRESTSSMQTYSLADFADRAIDPVRVFGRLVQG